MCRMMLEEALTESEGAHYKYPWIYCEILRLRIAPLVELFFQNDSTKLRCFCRLLDEEELKPM